MKKLLLAYILIFNIILANNGSYDIKLPQNYSSSNSNLTLIKSRGNWRRLGYQTASAGILAVGTLGILYALPEDITGWEDEGGIKNLGDKWFDHITTGPQWDHDRSFFNWIGHPYVGATYYMAARKSDFSQFDSFVYSAAMSSFFWEYGIEAFAEIPSIQDLIITPVLGSFLGEVFYHQEEKIRKNNNKLFGSKILGKTTIVIMDPIGSLIKVMGFDDNHVIGTWNVLVDEDSKKFDGLSLSIVGNL